MMLDAMIRATWGHLPHFREHHKYFESACPYCGGENRFVMFKDGDKVRGWCRQERQMYFSDLQVSEAERERLIAEAMRKEEEDREKQQMLIANLQQREAWKRWHNNLNPQSLNAWKKEGITKESIERYELGFVKGRRFFADGKPITSNALTIPAWNYENVVLNVWFRLLDPPSSGGKYRQLTNFPSSLFFASPNHNIQGNVFAVEGAKKAMVVNQEFEKAGIDMQVIALPSASPSKALLDMLSPAEKLYLCMDPDVFKRKQQQDGTWTEPLINRLMKEVRGNIFVVRLPSKPDDFFVKHGGTIDTFMSYVSYSQNFQRS